MLGRFYSALAFFAFIAIGCQAGNSVSRRLLESQFNNICELGAKGDLEGARAAIGKLKDINTVTDEGDSLLGYVTLGGNKELLALVLDAGGNPNGAGLSEMRPLDIAANKPGDNFRLVRVLLDSSANANGVNGDALRPLHYAAMRGNRKCAELLLDQGADPNIASSKGRSTPLHLAAERAHLEALEVLLKKGANSRLLDSAKRTSLDCAIAGRATAKKAGLPRGLLERFDHVIRLLKAADRPLRRAFLSTIIWDGSDYLQERKT